MTTDEKRFFIVKALAKDYISDCTAILGQGQIEDFNRALRFEELSDAKTLFKMVLKEVNAYNGKLSTKRTLIENLVYSRIWRDSKLFNNISLPYKKIDDLLKLHPEKDYYDIYLLLKN